MTLTIELPNDFTEHSDAPREVLEAFAIEGFRTEALTRGQAATLLGITKYDFEGLLKKHGIMEASYCVVDLQQDIKTGDHLRATGQIPG